MSPLLRTASIEGRQGRGTGLWRNTEEITNSTPPAHQLPPLPNTHPKTPSWILRFPLPQHFTDQEADLLGPKPPFVARVSQSRSPGPGSIPTPKVRRVAGAEAGLLVSPTPTFLLPGLAPLELRGNSEGRYDCILAWPRQDSPLGLGTPPEQLEEQPRLHPTPGPSFPISITRVAGTGETE